MSKIIALKCSCCGQYDEELVEGLCASCESEMKNPMEDPYAEEFRQFELVDDEPNWEVVLGSRDDLDLFDDYEDDLGCGPKCTCFRCQTYEADCAADYHSVLDGW